MLAQMNSVSSTQDLSVCWHCQPVPSVRRILIKLSDPRVGHQAGACRSWLTAWYAQSMAELQLLLGALWHRPSLISWHPPLFRVKPSRGKI